MESDAVVSPNITEVTVVRHGETEWNSQRRVQVAKKLSGGPKFSVVYSSDLKRAFDTAKTITKECGGLQGGGESIDQFCERSVTSLKRIAAKHRGKRIVVVGHGAYIEELYSRASLGKKSPHIPNGSINVLHLSEDDEWTIKTWCDVSHLQG